MYAYIYNIFYVHKNVNIFVKYKSINTRKTWVAPLSPRNHTVLVPLKPIFSTDH